MKNLIFLSGVVAVLLSAGGLCLRGGAAQAEGRGTVLYFFYGSECPHCKKVEPELQKLVRTYPNLMIKKFEVWHDQGNRNMLMKMAEERGKTARGVPAIIMGADFYMGSNIEKIRVIVAKNMKR